MSTYGAYNEFGEIFIIIVVVVFVVVIKTKNRKNSDKNRYPGNDNNFTVFLVIVPHTCTYSVNCEVTGVWWQVWLW